MFSNSNRQQPQNDPGWEAFDFAVTQMSIPLFEGSLGDPHSPETDENSYRVPTKQQDDLDEEKKRAATDHIPPLLRTPYESYRSVCDSGHVRLMRQHSLSPDDVGSPVESPPHQPEPLYPPPLPPHLNRGVLYQSQQRSLNTSHLSKMDPDPEERVRSRAEMAKTKRLEIWSVRFNELIEYRETHGDCRVPAKYKPNPSLGNWVNRQRQEKRLRDEGKRSSMTDAKIERLEKIGFIWWGKRVGQFINANWDSKYRELCEYNRLHGHCDVCCHESSALGRWVRGQRAEYKKFREGRSKVMTHEKIKKLNTLNFQWDSNETERFTAQGRRVGEEVENAQDENGASRRLSHEVSAV